MGLRIEKEEIWKRLTNRFKARTDADTDLLDPDYPVLLELLVPITNFDELLKEYRAHAKPTAARTAVAGVGWIVVYEVGEGKRAHVKGLNISRSGGDATISAVGVSASNALTTRVQMASLAAAAEWSQAFDEYIVLEEGMCIIAYVAAITGDSTFGVVVYEAVEDAF